MRFGPYEIWATLGIISIYGMVMVRLFLSPEERTHLFEYGLVGYVLFQALLERNKNLGQIRSPAIVAILGTGLLGWLDEIIQGFLPNRYYDLRDVGFNALAGLLAVAATLLLTWAKRIQEKKQS